MTIKRAMQLMPETESLKMTTQKVIATNYIQVVLIGLALSLVFPPSLQGSDASGWQKVDLGGDTRCADGSSYSIFVNQGSSGRMVVDFMGGGACWDDKTCDPSAINYTRSVPDVIGDWLPQSDGIYNRARPENPFRDDTHVLIPYCTGDVHWGEADKNYRRADGTAHTVFHRGAVNAKASLDYMFSQKKESIQQIVVTGCSAGAYASVWWTPYIRSHAPNAKIIQFSDSGAGVLTSQFRASGMRQWQIERSAPWWIPGLNPEDIDIYGLTLDEIYTAIATEHPDIQLTQYNSLNDILQRWFYQLMGGSMSAWSNIMRDSVEKSASRTPNFHYYIAPWDAHCILPYESFYARTSDAPDGVAFFEWMTQLLQTSNPVNEPCNGCAVESL